MQSNSQLNKIINALKTEGRVSRNDGIRGRFGKPILRMGVHIDTLRQRGWQIITHAVASSECRWSDCVYILKKMPSGAKTANSVATKSK